MRTGKDIEARTGKIFGSSIVSQDWYLWDNYGYTDSKAMHIYSQAADRSICTVQEQRYWSAYWRHFTSVNGGVTWCDEGPVLSACNDKDAFDSYTIWSGSVLQRDNGLVVAAYTGLKKGSLALQSMAIAVSGDGCKFDRVSPKRPLLSAALDYDELRSKGYYLGPRETIGDIDREADGIYLCFRDPFLFVDEQRKTHLYFGAKANKGKRIVGALGHAVFTDTEQLNSVKVLPPQFVPDADEFNLLELPNIFMRDGMYYLLISTSKLDYVGQPDLLARKSVRIYCSESSDGRWRPYGSDGSHVLLHPESKMHGLNIVNDVWNTTNMLTCRAYWVGESWLPPSLQLSVGGQRPELIFPGNLWNACEKPANGEDLEKNEGV